MVCHNDVRPRRCQLMLALRLSLPVDLCTVELIDATAIYNMYERADASRKQTPTEHMMTLRPSIGCGHQKYSIETAEARFLPRMCLIIAAQRQPQPNNLK